MRSTKHTLLLFCMAGLAAVAAACGTAATPAPTEVPATPTPLALPTAAVPQPAAATAAPGVSASTGSSTDLMGADLFQVSCAACHGADRSGSNFEVDGQKISAPALGWDDLSTTYATDPSRGTVEAQLALAITQGKGETGDDLDPMMPRWSSLSQAQVDSLIAYLKTPPTSGAPSLSPAAMNLTGQQLYEAACAACHGADGAGKTFTSDGNTITTPSLSWSELTQTYSANPSRGDVAQQVALSITKGQDETGGDLNPMMPHWSFLSQAQVDSLVQYLQNAFK